MRQGYSKPEVTGYVDADPYQSLQRPGLRTLMPEHFNERGTEEAGQLTPTVQVRATHLTSSCRFFSGGTRLSNGQPDTSSPCWRSCVTNARITHRRRFGALPEE